MYGHRQAQRETGFTLVEMMTVLAIVGTLLAIGVPSYNSITTSARMTSEVNGLLGDMQYARSEALRNGEAVSVCVSKDGTSCTGESDWRNGWIVFLNFNADDTVDGGDTLLRVQNPLPAKDSVTATDDLGIVTFNRSGFALGLPAGGTLVTLHEPESRPSYTRCLTITMAGLLKTQRHADAPDTCL
ncbi:MAG: GspH/FimT family pseudopilin [Gammaproteobacteria bacterium]